MFDGERGIRLSAIADRVCQRRNRVQLGYDLAYPSFEDLSLRRQYNTSNIKKDNHLRLSYVWRRERDSNPRYAFNVHTISNRALSASQTSLQSKRI